MLRLRYPVLTLFFLISWAHASALFASGITLHTWMAEKASEQLTIPEFSSFMQAHKAAFENGAVFPDSGYVIDHPYGEYAHWAPFLNAYYKVIRQRCPELQSESCGDLFAHFLGSLSHTIADINFDRHLVAEEARQDYNGDIGIAQTYTDPGLDFIAIFEHKRAFKIPEFRLPADDLVEVFHSGGEVEASAGDMIKAMSLVRLGLLGEPFGAPFTYFYYKAKMPWASKNYMQARGGVEDTARRIAKAWEMVWFAYHRSDADDRELFLDEGHWPNVDFFVDGAYLEEF